MLAIQEFRNKSSADSTSSLLDCTWWCVRCHMACQCLSGAEPRSPRASMFQKQAKVPFFQRPRTLNRLCSSLLPGGRMTELMLDVRSIENAGRGSCGVPSLSPQLRAVQYKISRTHLVLLLCTRNLLLISQSLNSKVPSRLRLRGCSVLTRSTAVS